MFWKKKNKNNEKQNKVRQPGDGLCLGDGLYLCKNYFYNDYCEYYIVDDNDNIIDSTYDEREVDNMIKRNNISYIRRQKINKILDKIK